MRRYKLNITGKDYTIDVQELAADRFYVRVGDEAYEVELSTHQDLAGAVITPEIVPLRAGDEAAIERPAIAYRPPAPESLRPLPAAPPPELPAAPPAAAGEFRAELRAPMPGTILAVEVKPGDKVTRGQTLVMLEAMKMKNALKAPHDAVVKQVLAQAGQTVRHGDVLVRFEEGAR
jgi:biotin carboxyl carrier protein